METETILPEFQNRKPWAAVLLAYLNSGLGQLYNGKIGKAVLFFIAEAVCSTWFLVILLSRPKISSILLWSLITGVFKIYTMIDAGFTASKIEQYKLQQFNRWYVYVLTVAALFLTVMLNGLVIRGTFYSPYSVPTGSMTGTILAGDFIIEDRFAYGLHIPYSGEYIFRNKQPERNDIVVFLTPENVSYIKRCIGLPGDSIEIINKEVFINGNLLPPPVTAKFSGYTMEKGTANMHIFPKGSEWNEDFYGPVRVPKSGDTIRFTAENLESWKDFIKRDSETGLHGISFASENKYYIVKKDYLFVMGDSRNNSLDSRYTGFVPVENVTGKASWIYFSRDLDNNKIRTERIGLELK